jgi:DNA-binding response OmpR family regulator
MGLRHCTVLQKKQFDIVISEINLHYLSGFKLFEIRKAKSTSTSVFIMTDDFEADSEMHALSLGAVEFIKKLFNRGVF